MTKNFVELIGFVGQDPQCIGNGKSPVKVSLATTQRWKDRAGQKQERTEWHTVYFWDRSAEVATTCVHKGSHILVTGSLRSRQYEGDGGKHTVWEIHARELLLLDPRRASAEADAEETPAPASEGNT